MDYDGSLNIIEKKNDSNQNQKDYVWRNKSFVTTNKWYKYYEIDFIQKLSMK
jgi:hypothetical protein